MTDPDKPRVRADTSYTMSEAPRENVRQKVGRKAGQQAEGLGYLVAVAVPWIAREFIPYPVPEEVLSAFSAYALSVAVRAKEHLF